MFLEIIWAAVVLIFSKMVLFIAGDEKSQFLS